MALIRQLRWLAARSPRPSRGRMLEKITPTCVTVPCNFKKGNVKNALYKEGGKAQHASTGPKILERRAILWT